MNDRTVKIEVNQQQEQLLDRLVGEGGFGDTHAEVVRAGFLRFCEANPELLAPGDGEGAGDE